MFQYSTLSGAYKGSLFTMYGDEAWKCSFNLDWDDSGKAIGSGYLTDGGDFTDENNQQLVDVVFLGQLTQKGVFYGVLVAPDRFEKGVAWSFNLELDVEERKLEGEVFYGEDSLGEGEPGSLFLKYQ